MKISVTGGAGFIGSHLVDRLIEQGHTVQVIDNLSTGSLSNVNEKAQFLNMDIRSSELTKVWAEFKPDYVFHEAAQTMVPVSMKDPALDCDVNLMGLINVLNSCVQNGVKKIIMPSSAAVYGDLDSLPLDETMAGKPSSFYGLTKLTTESYLELYAKNFNLPYICFRYANVYGPRQGHGGEGGVISIYCEHLQKGQDLAIFGDGEQTRDFVYVDDVVEANLLALEKPEVTGIYNVSTEKSTSLNELIGHFKDIVGKSFTVNYEAERAGDIKHSLLSIQKVHKDLAYSPKTELRDGLEKTYNYFIKK
ncbi:MAG: NAD-dependent epimerase/dehydratase family protein [Veillonella sp.]|uniref:NAD-dependent epimerase/dehydratase family protein n=1 Tax=Veillonella sp. TaxID=1926307 RepID=UPI0025F292EF|nr:NAD-dependent epimerase/dehydratase family protein [Veillonella sp.]MBS4913730.1 NAD-dependent epimerase/dehydratase family protein [Veillonella sp.]